MKTLMVLVLSLTAQAQPNVPDFTVETKENTLQILPPAGHHINPKAPMSVAAGNQKFKKQSAKEASAEFAIPRGFSGDYVASAFLCDDANTYCIKKTSKGSIRGTASVTTAASSAESAPQKVFRGMKGGFIYNEPDAALSLAEQSKKPLLIDFYGIWCPPCNVMDATVFEKKKFKDAAKDFILLKLDADDPVSWKLKEKYKIGGYPTFIFADSNAEEISRVVGSRRPGDFYNEMAKAYKLKDAPLSSLKSKANEGNEEAMTRLGEQALEREEAETALMWLNKASAQWKPGDRKFESLFNAKLKVLKEETKDNSDKPETHAKFEKFRTEAIQSAAVGPFKFYQALSLAELYGEMKNSEKEKATYEMAIDIGKKLTANPKLLGDVEDGPEMIYEYMGDAYKSIGKKEEAKQAFAQGAKEFEKLIRKYGLSPNEERGWNLELAYCLRESDQKAKAIKIYKSLQAHYPTDFTYYNSHARTLMSDKKFAEAEPIAKKAYEYSYGDNRLRMGMLLADVYEGLNQKDKALAVVKQTLAESKKPSDKYNRGLRYIEQLKKYEKKLSEAKT